MPKFEKLQVWEKGVKLVVFIYNITSQGKIEKDFGMRDQMRRSASSIPANIAEGDEMDSVKQSLRYFKIAKGSSGELYTHAETAKRVGLLDHKEADFIQSECVAISGMLGNLIKARQAQIK